MIIEQLINLIINFAPKTIKTKIIMLRQIITPKNKKDLIFHIPDKYLTKEVEIIVFEIKEPNSEISNEKKKKLKKAIDYFNSMEAINMKDFKFNRDEANER